MFNYTDCKWKAKLVLKKCSKNDTFVRDLRFMSPIIPFYESGDESQLTIVCILLTTSEGGY